MLRGLIWTGIAAACAVAAPAAAQQVTPQTEKDTRYLRLEGGYVFGWDRDHVAPPGANALTGNIEFNDGYTVAVEAGRYFAPNWRGELELSYLHNAVGDYTNFDPAEGDIRAYTAMVNVYRDFPMGQHLRPFLGGGIGAVLIDPDYVVIPGPITDGKDLNFGVQGSAGVDYDINDRTSIGVRYRYIWAGKYDFGPYSVRYSPHSLLAGVRVAFQKAAPPPPPPPPPPAPPPPPPPAEPNELLNSVLFPHDSYEITPAAAAVLDEVVRVIRARNITLIRLEGHTDTTGSSEYNMILSQHRAEAVRDGLIARGVPPTNVYISAKGETDLRVPTADNVRNQDNRYVKIFVRYD